MIQEEQSLSAEALRSLQLHKNQQQSLQDGAQFGNCKTAKLTLHAQQNISITQSLSTAEPARWCPVWQLQDFETHLACKT